LYLAECGLLSSFLPVELGLSVPMWPTLWTAFLTNQVLPGRPRKLITQPIRLTSLTFSTVPYNRICILFCFSTRGPLFHSATQLLLYFHLIFWLFFGAAFRLSQITHLDLGNSLNGMPKNVLLPFMTFVWAKYCIICINHTDN